jgi:F-type H+-transporting ATPase subunit delta
MASDPKLLAKRLAKAFHEAIVESIGEKSVEKVRSQMEGLIDLSKGEVGSFFSNPVFSVEEKTAVLTKILSKQKLEEGLKRFLGLILSIHALHLLPEILSAYNDAERDRKNEAEAKVKTAFPLTAEEKEKVSKALSKATGRKISLQIETDKSLIGGLTAQVGSRLFDASVKGYLNRLIEEY